MKIEYYKGNYKYLLKSMAKYMTNIVDVEMSLPFYELLSDGLLIIKPGYAWDGPSGPTFDTKSFMRGSLIHDVLYQILRNPDLQITNNKHIILRHQADLILHDICVEDGMWKWRAKWVLRGVRAGGGPSAAMKKRPVYMAP